MTDLERALSIITAAQDVLAEYIVPDSGVSDFDCVNRLLSILDDQDNVRFDRTALAPSVEAGEPTTEQIDEFQFLSHLQVGIHDCIGLDQHKLAIAKRLRAKGHVTIADSADGPMVTLTEAGAIASLEGLVRAASPPPVAEGMVTVPRLALSKIMQAFGSLRHNDGVCGPEEIIPFDGPATLGDVWTVREALAAPQSGRRSGGMKLKDAIKDAADAHTRLTVFYAVIGLMEGGTLPGGSESASKTAKTIIDFCRREAARQLDEYDRNVALILKAGDRP